MCSIPGTGHPAFRENVTEFDDACTTPHFLAAGKRKYRRRSRFMSDNIWGYQPTTGHAAGTDLIGY
ncbi:hypothetical protein ACWD7F_38995, partial [Streptomyces sp. NPDC005122]